MSYYETFLLFLALLFCGYASYTDLKMQKIRNVCSLGLLYVGTLSQLMAWYLGTTTPLYILGLFFRERCYCVWILLVRYLLTGGFQIILGTVSDFSVIAFRKFER